MVVESRSEGERKIRNYNDLLAWQKARDLVKVVYRATERFPAREAYGLTQQLRRAAVSVPSNIAEGYGRGARREYVRFLRTARGSLYEVQTQLLLAQDLGYLSEEAAGEAMKPAIQCCQLLNGLLRGLAGRKGADEEAKSAGSG
jgi:four helix bundle protein